MYCGEGLANAAARFSLVLMQPDHIDTFLDLFETRNFNRSAERLSVTQSTVSGRIAALERNLGVTLFRRSRAGCEPTTEGLRFEPHARALRHAQTEARAAVRGTGGQAMVIRLGLQYDIAASDPSGWVVRLRETLPQAALYIEADYSAQTCRDVQDGGLDLGLIFTPHPAPDLHFESLNEMRYRMIAATQTELHDLSDISPEHYVFANISPALARTHLALLPHLSQPPVQVGQSAMVEGLVTGLGLAGYVEASAADRLVKSGAARSIAGAPILTQPVYAAIHHRNRHRAVWRSLLRALRTNLEGQK